MFNEFNQDFTPPYDSDLLMLNNATYRTSSKLLMLLLTSEIYVSPSGASSYCLTSVSISPLSPSYPQTKCFSLLSDFLVSLLISPLLNADLHPSLLFLCPFFTFHLHIHKLHIVFSEATWPAQRSRSWKVVGFLL